MEIDIYQLCPCQSGKKIKFCCGKDIVTDLNQIYSKFQSGQIGSAISLIDRSVAKNGERDCLMTLKTFLLLSRQDIDAADESNKAFLAKNPSHSLGLQHSALILLHRGDVLGAMNRLQDAMESVEGDEIPLSVANAFRMIGIGLARAGFANAAREHLQYALFIKGQDDRLQAMVGETFRAPGMSILLKGEFKLDPPNEEIEAAEWGKSYQNVIRLMDRGQFRRGYNLLKRIDEKYPDQPIVVRALSVLALVLVDVEAMPVAFRRRAALPGASLWDQVECEATAQLFEGQHSSREIDVLLISFEINDFDKALENLTASARSSAVPAPAEDPFEKGPPPRSCFFLLDKDEVLHGKDLTAENAPSVVAEVFLYGKQTDRPACAMFVAPELENLAEVSDTLQQVLGDSFEKESGREVVGGSEEAAEKLNWSWRFPTDTGYEKHLKTIAECRTRSLIEDWSEIEFAILGNRSVKTAAADDPDAVVLKAFLLQMETTLEDEYLFEETIDKLYDALGVARMPQIDPEGEDVGSPSPMRFRYQPVDKISDEKLQALTQHCLVIGYDAALRRFIPELLKRELTDWIPLEVLLSLMSKYADSTEESLEFLQQAKAECKSAGKPYGMYLVQEFEMYLSRGVTEPLESLFHRISHNHLDEPGVEERVTQILQRYNMMGDPAAAEAQADVPAEDPGLLLDSPEPEPSSAGSSSEESTLWLPGQD